MTIQHHLINSEGTHETLYTDAMGTPDCATCLIAARTNAGSVTYSSAHLARLNGHLRGTNINSPSQREGSYGFIDYSAASEVTARRVMMWNADGSANPVPGEVAADTQTDADVPERHSLFVAVALANGVGGVVRSIHGRLDATIRLCDAVETGAVWMAADALDTDGVRYDYSNHTSAAWFVVSVSPDAPTAPAAGTPQTTVIPRTSAEAVTMANLVRDITSADASATQTDVLRSLDTLALMLPGGRAEASGLRLAESRSLCEVYERTVCPTLGWAPRPDMGHDSSAPAQFVNAIVQHERNHSELGVGESIIRFAERYERGGSVNEAILDSMETSLEDHKRGDANQVLDALGLETLESRIPPTHEYEVEVTLSRVVTRTETQTVTVMVDATDEDAARAMVYDGEVDPWDEDTGDWDSDGYDDIDSSDIEIGYITEV